MNLSSGTFMQNLPTGTIDNLQAILPLTIGMPSSPQTIQSSILQVSDYLGINNGWFPVTDTWTYASASTITIPADGTTKYQKGMPIRFKQGGGYKYFNIASVTSTLITVFVNTDHVVANSAITDIAVSLIPNPFGFPLTFNYTTTVTSSGGSITSYSVTTAVYTVFGSQIKIDWNFTITNNGTGSGELRATLPITCSKLGIGSGREDAAVGKTLQIVVAAAATYARIINYDNTYPGGTGYQMLATAMYGY